MSVRLLIVGLLCSVTQVLGQTAKPEDAAVESMDLSGNTIEYETLGDGTLILKGTDADLDQLEKMLMRLDQDTERPVIRYVQLKNVLAKDLAGRLQPLYQAVLGNRPEDKITIVADESSNSLLIAAPERVIEEIVKMALDLDQITSPAAPEYEVIQLQFIKASEAAESLNEWLPKLYKGKPGGDKIIEQINVEPNDRNNTLRVTAPQEMIEQIRQLVADLDVEPMGLAKAQVLFIQLVNARAEDLAKSLSEILAAQGDQAEKLKETILRMRFTRVGRDGTLEDFPELDLDKPIKIVAEQGTNSLFIATSENNVPALTALVQLLDAMPTAPEMAFNFFPLKHADAENVVTVLKEMFEAGSKLAQVPDRDIKAAVPEGVPGKAFAYNVGLHADTRTNTVVVSGRPEQLAVAAAVIKHFDIEGGVLFPKPRILYLEHTDADRLANILTQLNEQTVKSLEDRKAGVAAIDKERALIIADYRSNSLIISATEEKFEAITDLAQKLDRSPSQFVNDIRIVNCTVTNAGDLESKITALWERKAKLREREDLPQDAPVVVADQRSNALVIASNIEDYNAVKRLVEDLEAQPLAPMAMIRLIPLKNNDAAEMAGMLKSLFEERLQLRPTPSGQENSADKVAITSDPATNTMLVASSAENYTEIMRIIESLDVIPDLEGQVRTFVLENADATNVLSKVKDLFDQGIYKPGAAGGGAVTEARDKVALISDGRVNAIMVSASRPNMAIIERLIKEMDTVDVTDLLGSTQIFQLTHADALKVTEILTKVFEGLKNTAGDSQEVIIVPSIIPVEGSNALIVAGSKDGIHRTKALLQQIDKPSETPTSQFEVYALQHASSVKLAPKMVQMFEKRNAGGDGKATPINIEAVEGSNSIICSASAEDQGVIRSLIALLDVKSNLNQQLRIYNLDSANAESASTLLSELFTSQPGGGGEDGLASAIAVQAVPWTNSIAVWASPGQMEDIEHMIRTIDTNVPTREMMFDVIQLKRAMVQELVDALSKTLQGEDTADDQQKSMILSFFEDLPDGSQVLRKLIRQDISLVPYVQTNSLLVMAPPDSVEMLHSLIRRMDSIPPLTSEVRVIKLYNADAEQVISTLERLFEAGTATGDQPEAVLTVGEGGLPIGESGARLGLTFAVDPRTNSVIVAGNEHYLKLVQNLIEQLDGVEEDQRRNLVYHVRNSTSEEIAGAIQEFNQQESDRLSALEDATSDFLKREQAITMVSSEGQNAVLASMSPRYESQYMEMIRQLDRAPEQVLIEVMVVQVTLDDRFELGIEFAWQDLAFSEKAIAGPNGTVLGPNKDVVIGTDLGAAGSGGGLAITVSGEDFNFLFHALQTNGRAELISRPSLMVKNNETGLIEIIQQVPIPSATNVSDGGTQQTSITYEDAGITLEVEPHINPDGYIQLSVRPEVSSIGAPIPVSGDVQASTFQRTRLDTTITIKDGETVVIGGLIENNITNSESKIPLLGDLPVVGQLFRSNEDIHRRAELLIVITATVLRTPEDALRSSEHLRDETKIVPERTLHDPMMQGLQLNPGPGGIEIKDKPLLKQSEEDLYGPQPGSYGPPTPRRAQQVNYVPQKGQ